MKNQNLIIVIVLVVALVGIGWYAYDQGWLDFEEQSIAGVYHYNLGSGTSSMYMEFDEYGVNRVWDSLYDIEPGIYSYVLLEDSNGNGKKEFRLSSPTSNNYMLWDYEKDEYNSLEITLIEANHYDDFTPGMSLTLHYFGVPGSFEPEEPGDPY